MKIHIDEKSFNKAISENKFELAQFLLDNSCPIDTSCYFQDLRIETLEWLKSRGIPLNKHCLKELIIKTDELDIIEWFVDNGVIPDNDCLNSCIDLRNDKLFLWIVEKYNLELSTDNFISAIKTENTSILEYLKSKKCPYDERLVEAAIKYSKRESIKWLVNNGFF